MYTDVAYASMILVTPFIIMMFMFIGVNLKTFKDETAAPYYSAGYGLFFGGTIEFWKLLITESRYSDMSIGDFLIITLFGLGTVVFLGDMSTAEPVTQRLRCCEYEQHLENSKPLQGTKRFIHETVAM